MELGFYFFCACNPKLAAVHQPSIFVYGCFLFIKCKVLAANKGALYQLLFIFFLPYQSSRRVLANQLLPILQMHRFFSSHVVNSFIHSMFCFTTSIFFFLLSFSFFLTAVVDFFLGFHQALVAKEVFFSFSHYRQEPELLSRKQ